jgi:trimeric autotransporter adhesin
MALAVAAYRFGSDDGSESTHGWLADLNTALSRDKTDAGVFLVRFLVQATGAGQLNCVFQLRCSLDGGAFADVTTTSTGVQAVAAASFLNAANTTSRLGGSGTFETSSAGASEDGSAGGTAFDIVTDGRGECLYSVALVPADLTSVSTITFELQVSGAAFTQSVTPTINLTSTALPVVTSIDTDNDTVDTRTGVVIAGTDFGASATGSARVDIFDGVSVVVEIDVTAWSNTSITVTMRRKSDNAALATLMSLPRTAGVIVYTSSGQSNELTPFQFTLRPPGPTPVGALNEDLTLAINTTYLLRSRVENSGGVGGTAFKWRARKNGGAYFDITTVSADVKAVAASSFANNDDVPELLGGTGSYITNNDAASEDGSFSLPAPISGNAAVEPVLAFQITSAGTFDFKIVKGDGTDLDSYSQTFTATVEAGVTHVTITTTLEALAKKQGLLATTTLAAAGQTSFTLPASFEASGQTQRLATATLEAAAQKPLAATSAFDALGAPYTAVPVSFDGTDWLLSSSLSGASDVVSGTISVWFRLAAAGQGTQRSILDSQASRVRLVYFSTNAGEIRFRDTAGADTIRATLPTVTDERWHHVILTTDGTAGQCYFDDQPRSLVVAPTNVAIDWTLLNFSIGATITGTALYNGDLAELWASNVYVGDLAVTANRRKFILADGTPPDLGSNGSIPTGSAPLIYNSGLTADWHTNKGTGGGFTLTGTLSDGQSPVQLTTITARTATFTLEALAQQQGLLATTALTAAGQTPFSIAATLESAAQKRLTSTASLEAAAQKALSAAATLEAAAQKAVTLTTSLEAAGRTGRTSTASLEAAARTARTATLSLEAAAALTRAITATLDAVAKKAITVTASLDAVAAVQITRTLIATLEAAAQKAVTAIATLDAAAQARMSATASLDARGAIQATNTITATFEAAAQQQRLASAALDAVAAVTRTVIASFDGVAQSHLSLTAGLDAIAKATLTAQATLDAAARKQIETTASFDSIASSGVSNVFSVLDAAAQMHLNVTATLEAKGVLAKQLTASLDAAAQRQITAQITLDAVASLIGTVQATFNSVAQKNVSVAATFEAYGEYTIVAGEIGAALDALAQARLTIAATLAAAGQTSFEIQAALDAVSRETMAAVASFEATAQVQRTQTASFEAVAQAARTVSTSLEAFAIQIVAGQLSATFESAGQTAFSASAFLEAVAQVRRTQTASLEAAGKGTRTATASLDALAALIGATQVLATFEAAALKTGFSATAFFDAAVALAAQTRTATLNAVASVPRTLSASLEALARASLQQITSFDAAAQKNLTVAATLEARAVLFKTITASIDATARKALTVSATFEAAARDTRTTASAFDAAAAKTFALQGSFDSVAALIRFVSADFDASAQRQGIFASAFFDAVVGELRAPPGRRVDVPGRPPVTEVSGHGRSIEVPPQPGVIQVPGRPRGIPVPPASHTTVH